MGINLSNLNSHHMMLIVLGIGVALSLSISIYKIRTKKMENNEESVLNVVHIAFDLVFAVTMIAVAIFKPEILLKNGELLTPLVLGGISLATRSYFKLIK